MLIRQFLIHIYIDFLSVDLYSRFYKHEILKLIIILFDVYAQTDGTTAHFYEWQWADSFVVPFSLFILFVSSSFIERYHKNWKKGIKENNQRGNKVSEPPTCAIFPSTFPRLSSDCTAANSSAARLALRRVVFVLLSTIKYPIDLSLSLVLLFYFQRRSNPQTAKTAKKRCTARKKEKKN